MKISKDVTILGGGLAGLSLALQVRQQAPDADITVLENRKHPAPEAAFKVGESTVEVAAHYFGEILGLREHLVKDQLPKLALRFFFPAGDNSRIEDRLELGTSNYPKCPSFQLDRGRFENFLVERCLQEGIDFVDQANVRQVEIARAGIGHEIRYVSNQESQSHRSRWIVDASGRRAFLKKQLDLGKDSPHLANAVWFRIDSRIKVDDWSSDAQWSSGHHGPTGRWYSTNHLMGKGYWVWLIPLASGSTSVGIVASEAEHSLSSFNSLEKATEWLETYEPQCAEIVRANLDKVQDFKAIKRYATECQRVFSMNRWGITGEAGFFHDPFYSPGSDFIAFANTFLSDLIRRDLSGRGFRIRVLAYNKAFKKFYYGTAKAYQDQYAIFGNPIVMPVKILWDYMVYWSVTGFFFMHGRICQQSMYMRNMFKLGRLTRVNKFMQDFFRMWHASTDGQPQSGVIDTALMPIIGESNRRLLDVLSNREFVQRFDVHMRQLESLCQEIVDRSGLNVSIPFRPKAFRGPFLGDFENAFRPQDRGSNIRAEAS